jgi:hypothetical protein
VGKAAPNGVNCTDLEHRVEQNHNAFCGVGKTVLGALRVLPAHPDLQACTWSLLVSEFLKIVILLTIYFLIFIAR